MNTLTQFLKVSSMTLFCGILLSACTSDEPNANPQPEPLDPLGSVNLDSISDHLQFLNATKIQGTIPNGPAVSTLKISFKDTLYLNNELKKPIRFLHEDTTKNVAGIYLQVHGAVGGSNATYYYDVPETPDFGEGDTVSVIMIGVDPVGLIDPAGVPPAGAPPFQVTIVPYGKDREPLAQATRPGKIKDYNKPGACSLVTAPGDYWKWYMSYIQDQFDYNKILFLSKPNIIFGAVGQVIKGNCCNGVSTYGFCSIGDTTLNASLHFATYYQITHQSLVFFDDGTFFRQTFEKTANPAPGESNFCAGGEGVVHKRINHTTYNGNWTIHLTTVPSNFVIFTRQGAMLQYLTLQGTSSSPPGSGFGNPGGLVAFMDCNSFYLMQLDKEVFGQALISYYYRTNNAHWFAFT